MAWFGPKGVATMTFSLFVLAEGIPAGETIFNLAALTVFVSIVAHGLTDTAGGRLAGTPVARRDRGAVGEGGGLAGPPEGRSGLALAYRNDSQGSHSAGLCGAGLGEADRVGPDPFAQDVEVGGGRRLCRG